MGFSMKRRYLNVKRGVHFEGKKQQHWCLQFVVAASAAAVAATAAATFFTLKFVMDVKFARTKAMLSHRNTVNNSIEIGVLAPWNLKPSKPLCNRKKWLVVNYMPCLKCEEKNASNKLLMDGIRMKTSQQLSGGLQFERKEKENKKLYIESTSALLLTRSVQPYCAQLNFTEKG